MEIYKKIKWYVAVLSFVFFVAGCQKSGDVIGNPSDRIPSDLPSKVRKQLEALWTTRDLDDIFTAAKGMEDLGESKYQAVPFLASIVADKELDYLDRFPAVSALGMIPDPRSYDALLPVLTEADMRMRNWAVLSLGVVRDFRAVAPLTQALMDKEPIVRKSAKLSLDMLGEDLIRTIRKRKALFLPKGFQVERGSSLDWLGGIDKGLVVLASSRLGPKFANPVPFLNETMKVGSVDMQLFVLTALKDLQTEDATKALCKAAIKKNIKVRLSAVNGLIHRDRTQVIPILVARLKDSESVVRRAAAIVLRLYQDPATVEALISTLEDGEVLVRQEAAKALVAIGQPAVHPLVISLKRKKWKNDVFHDLSKINNTVDLLYGSGRNLDFYGPLGVIWILVKIGNKSVEPLIGVLQDTDADVRLAAVIALTSIKDTKAIKVFKKMLRDDDERVRDAVQNALGALNP